MGSVLVCRKRQKKGVGGGSWGQVNLVYEKCERMSVTHILVWNLRNLLESKGEDNRRGGKQGLGGRKHAFEMRWGTGHCDQHHTFFRLLNQIPT